MSLKGYLVITPECAKKCDDAVEAMRDFIGDEEVEVLEPAEALRRGIDIGEPEGVPVLCICSEHTGKRMNHMYFREEDGKLMLEPYPTVYKGDEEPEEEGQESSGHGRGAEVRRREMEGSGEHGEGD